ncbi:putative Ig domain-containing protein [Flavobacterium sp.]|uniref:putative Ig domain-containing protein n=1 Tax=Flavobacterium sp. TaxID=239 RepID=UPI004047090D
MKLKLFVVLLFSSVMSWGQTTVSYDFSSGGAVTGLNQAAPGISLDANIGFGSFKNSGTASPTINSGQLRLYQNGTKGGSILIYASNGVTITQVRVFASGTTGPAAFSVDGGASSSLTISAGVYTMSSLSSTNNVEFWCTGTSSGTRIYVDSFEVTYTSGASTYNVTYDGNGNDSGSVPVDATVYNFGESVTVLGNSGSLVKTGFAFNGWNTASDGSGTAYVAGNTFSISANTTLFAQWLNTSPPVITSSLTASGNVGSAFTYDIVATNLPTSYNATGLPSGLSINTTTGQISGTPTAAGVFNVTISATNAYGTDSETLEITFVVGPCLSEDFETGSTSISTWDTGGGNGVTVNASSGNNYMSFNNTGEYAVIPINNISSLEFDLAGSTTSNGWTLYIQVSSDNITWSDITTISGATINTSFSLQTVNLGATYQYVRLYLQRTGNSCYIDNLNAYCGAVVTPDIVLSSSNPAVAASNITQGTTNNVIMLLI